MKIGGSRQNLHGIDAKIPKKQKILSVSTDCTGCDCETPTEDTRESTSAEDVSVESNDDPSQPSASQHSKDGCEVSFSFSSKSCKASKMYLVTRKKGEKQYFLYIINMDGNIEQQVELKSLDNKELKQVRIFCIKNRKVIILDVAEGNLDMHIFNYEGKYLKTIDMKQYLTKRRFSRVTIFTISYNGEIFCFDEKSKLTIYNIDEENEIPKTNETILLKNYVPQSVAFNRKFEELIILCHTSRLSRPQYHLLIYTRSGTLEKDIKLRDNADYREAMLIYHQNGPVVLLHNQQLLHLK